jgi:phenylacetic acid degradation operon negative regulatory protein
VVEARREIRQLADRLRLNAAAFIVTIYGDVVVPRGGVVWTGTLIELCAEVGISETLVRTAVSRLVAAEQLAGERIGRRSFYRLRTSAVQTFMQAADLLYGPDRPAQGWQILHDPALRPEDARRQRMGHMGGPVFIRPDRGQPLPPTPSSAMRSVRRSGAMRARLARCAPMIWRRCRWRR